MAKYYSTNSNRAYTTQQYIANYGFNPDNADQTVLRTVYSTYPVNEAAVPVVDPNIYAGTTATYLINIDNVTYDEVYTLVERPLASAKSFSIAKLNDTAEYDSIVALGGTPNFTGEELDSFRVNGPYTKFGGESEAILATQSYLTAANRIEPYKTIAVAVNAIGTQLQADVAAVNAATTIKEVGVAYYNFQGIISTGRGAGLGADDLNQSYFVNFFHPTLDVSELELYVPSTSTVISYTPGDPLNQFDSAGNCFNGVDYIVEIREVTTSTVLAEFEVPLSPTNVNVSFS